MATTPNNETLDVAIIGAGFAGVFAVHRFRQLGLKLRCFERGSDVGGTWYWNRYPGARCDAPSMQYSYQFSNELQQDWHWSEKFAAQPEILRYIQHVAERFDIYPDIQFDTEISSIHFDESSRLWRLSTAEGESIAARFCVMATGCLSTLNVPDFPGLTEFSGTTYHTSAWPKEPVDFSGQRVGVIGTGSTGIQLIPVVAEQAEHLYVFQRTAQYSTPARNESLDPEYEAKIKAEYPEFRRRNYRLPLAMDIHLNPEAPKTFDVDEQTRRTEYERRWALGGMSLLLAYRDTTMNYEANETVSDFIREKIEQTVDDPATAELLKPKHIYGCKRPCLDSNYYQTFNRDNVSLVDISDGGVETFTSDGVRAGGKEYDLDCVIFATGFDAMTGALNRIDIRGRNGRALKDKWADGPRAYLGLASADFPNMFTVSGPGSPSVLTNMVPTIEQHVNWIAECIEYTRAQGYTLVEATPEAEDPWLVHVQEVADRTLWNACDNWYQGANIPGKPRVFMPYVDWPAYMRKCEEVTAGGYVGFAFA